jgi:hypothetical protein
MNLHGDYLLTLPKEEKLGRLEESQPFSPPLELWSPPRTRSKDRRCERNVFDAARAFSEDVCTKTAAFGHVKPGLGDLEQKMTQA